MEIKIRRMKEVETLPYTYLFEDNWPTTGDYDMNDLVIGIQINNKKIGGKTESAKIIYTAICHRRYKANWGWFPIGWYSRFGGFWR